MWPFALLAVACIPLMGFATSLEMKTMLGEDAGEENAKDETSSPGGIVVETLLNMGTVSALTMEEERFKIFKEALNNSDEHYVREGFHQGGFLQFVARNGYISILSIYLPSSHYFCLVFFIFPSTGVLAGLAMFIQQWINALQMFFGGWLLFRYPDKYGFNDFLISNFAILFSLFGLGAAFQDISDRKETEKSASRIFYLLDRSSEIDPLSDEGKTLDTTVDRPKPKKSHSIKKEKKKRVSSLNNVVEESEMTEEEEICKISDTSPEKSPKKKKKSSKKIMEKMEADEKADTDATPIDGREAMATENAGDDKVIAPIAMEKEATAPEKEKRPSMKKKKSKRASKNKLTETTKANNDNDAATPTEGGEEATSTVTTDIAEALGEEPATMPERPKSLKKKKSSKKKKKPKDEEGTTDADAAA